ncbi:hypothetical protein O181_059776 [Austropuccinia psidii MF-1]|uniref:Uncharacterized protein n=1 Tax=Austropuccinia psidii MF-1 TaxID=1389203 RepID=A0A9Q3HVZ5_9BASI|nr:hypothetical protein [Austropuccinia psidii MF-1]
MAKTRRFLVQTLFEDNPTEENHTAVELLVEETCQSDPTPALHKTRRSKKLVFQGSTIQESEEEDPNTPYNQMELKSEVELIPQKGKEEAKSPVEQNSLKEVSYPKDMSQKCL